MKDDSSKPFCILPWIHLNNSTDGKVLACCQSTGEVDLGNLNHSSIEDIWNSDQFNAFRESIRRGELQANCRKCYEKEEVGIKSFRQICNEEFAHLIPLARENTASIRYLELRFSNVCNLYCKTCGPAFSSSWNKFSDKKYSLSLTANGEDIVESCRPYMKQIEKVHFSGGEPLLQTNHYQFLKALIAEGRTDLYLSYNSNLTVLSLGNENILDYWKKFKKIKLLVSIDGIEERGEYIRTGLNWKTLLDNIHTIQTQVPHVQLFISLTLSIFNIYHVVECFTELFERGIVASTDRLLIQYLDKPEFYNINMLNPEEIEQLDELYTTKLIKARTLLSEENYQMLERELTNVITFLRANHSSPYRKTFPKVVLKIDKLMGGNFLKTFPELAPFYMGELIQIPRP